MIFGSTALNYYYPDFRKPKDLDIINVETKEKILTKGVEKYWIPEYQLLIDRSKNKEYLDPELMLTLKASHANWNIHWEKTMFDIMFLIETFKDLRYDGFD